MLYMYKYSALFSLSAWLPYKYDIYTYTSATFSSAFLNCNDVYAKSPESNLTPTAW